MAWRGVAWRGVAWRGPNPTQPLCQAKHKFHVDDALDVTMVHGLTGVVGALSVGLFASEEHSGIVGANGAYVSPLTD